MTPTEKLEANLEKRLAKEYRKARAELTKELKATLKEFNEKDAWYKEQLRQGKILQDTYKEWREAQLQHSQWVRNMRDQIAVDLYHVNRIATDMINGTSPYAFCESVNYETYKLEHDMKIDTSFTLYSKSTLGALLKEHPSIMPRKVNKKKDTRWNRQNVTSALAQAVLQGDDTKQLSKRLMNVVDMNETSAMLASRTIMNSASNAGKQESIDRAIEAGIPVEKGWLAVLDQRTRHSHRHMDMEFVKGNEKFSNGMMFPCDWSADIPNIGAEIYNCRCQMITRIADIPFDMSGRNEKLGDMSYEEWKKGKENPTKETKKALPDNATLKQRLDYAIQGLNGEEKIMAAGKIVSEEFNKRINALQTEASMKRTAWKEAIKRKEEASDKDWDRASEEEYKALLEMNEATEKLSWGEESHREYLLNMLKEIRPMGIDKESLKGHFDGDSKMFKHIEEAYNYYPTDWIKRSLSHSKLNIFKASRGEYNDDTDTLYLSGNSKKDLLETAIHELAHRFEDSVPGFVQAEEELYNRRTKDEDIVPLGRGYGSGECTKKDNWIDPYIGSFYMYDAYEIASMGFQYAYMNPEMLLKDPEYQEFILGLLAVL